MRHINRIGVVILWVVVLFALSGCPQQQTQSGFKVTAAEAVFMPGIAPFNIPLAGTNVTGSYKNALPGTVTGNTTSFSDTTNMSGDLHSSVAAMLREFIGERTSSSKAGKPLGQSNILRRTLHPILAELNEPKCGSHAFRRFRLSWLRENKVPKDLEHFWMGHADEEVGDLYSQLENNVQFRKKVAEEAGLGFKLPSKKSVVGLNGPKRTEMPDSQLVASV